MRFKADGSIKSLWQQLEKQPALIWMMSILWLVLLSGLAFVWHLGTTGLVDETEPLFAEAARQMTVTGDWVTPYFNGNTRFDKPPLIYWLMAIAYKTIGVNEWAVRLPSALSAIALTIFGFYTLRYFGVPIVKNADEQPPQQTEQHQWLAAWIGAALIALNLQTILWARTGVSDMLLSGCMGSALLAFFWGYVQPLGSKAKPRWYLAFYVLIALAVLTKGPVGLVLPALIIGAFLLYLGNGRPVLKEMQLWQGILIVLVLAVPWYVLVTLANGDAFVDSFFGYHNFQRFTRAVNNHKAAWFFYVGVILVGFAPWSLHLPVAIARMRFWKPAYWRNQPRSAQLGLFALIWFAVIFGFFTIAKTKLPSYVLPLLPAAAILVGLLWSSQMTCSSRSSMDSLNQKQPEGSVDNADSRSRRRSDRAQSGMVVSNIANVLFWLVLSAVIARSASWMDGDPAMPDFPGIVQQSGLLIWGSVVCAIAAILQIILLVRSQSRWLWLVNLLALSAFIIVTVMPFSLLVDAQRQLPLRQLAATIVEEQRPREEIVMVGFPKPSLTFYTQEKVTYMPHTEDMAKRLRRPYRAGRSVLILGLPRKLSELDLQPNQYQLLNQAGAYQLIRVDLPLQPM